MDEKIAKLVNVAPAIRRLGIPACNWWTESLHGAFGPVPTTNFPEPIGLAASFDLSPRDLSSVDPEGGRSALAGRYTLSLGGGQPGQGLPRVETGFTVNQSAAVPR